MCQFITFACRFDSSKLGFTHLLRLCFVVLNVAAAKTLKRQNFHDGRAGCRNVLFTMILSFGKFREDDQFPKISKRTWTTLFLVSFRAASVIQILQHQVLHSLTWLLFPHNHLTKFHQYVRRVFVAEPHLEIPSKVNGSRKASK